VARFLGIDIGTSFLKGAVLDIADQSVTHIHRLPVPASVPALPPTRYELEPAAILSAVRDLLRQLLGAAPDATGLVLCSQMHCLVLLDEHAQPRSNVITWKDQRALEPSASGRGSHFDELNALVTDDERRQLGGELRVGVPVSTLFALQREQSLPAGLWAASLPDYVLASLCSVEPSTDPTLAAAQGLFNVEAHDWHHALIEKLGLSSLRWPRIRRTGERVGDAKIDGHRLPCFAPIGDQQCALLGAGLQEQELSLNISTGSQASLLSRELPRGKFQVRPYVSGQWLRTIVSVPAGRSLSALVELLTEIGRASSQPQLDAWDYIRAAVDRTPTTDLTVDLSFFSSLMGDRGGITNIGEGNLSVGHLFLAAFRGMAANYARCARLLSPNRDWDRIVFSGGLAQGFPRLRREVLEALGDPPHRLCSTEEDTLAGLLLLAGKCDEA
jgi:xylulokinase